jgi:hypothetical protein
LREAGAAAPALLDDLADAERSWLAWQASCADVACLTVAYDEQIAMLRFEPRPGRNAPADRWAGRYGHGGFMKLLAQARDDGSIRLVVSGAEPKTAAWTCAFGGIGRVMGDTVEITRPAPLTAHLLPGAIELPRTAANQATSERSCGPNGSILWTYTRTRTW